MPNSLLEALACGVPIISTDVGGVSFMVAHESSALLVPVNDEQRMADAIVRLSADSDLRRTLTLNGLSEVRQYAWPQVKDQWLDLYALAAQRQAA